MSTTKTNTATMRAASETDALDEIALSLSPLGLACSSLGPRGLTAAFDRVDSLSTTGADAVDEIELSLSSLGLEYSSLGLLMPSDADAMDSACTTPVEGSFFPTARPCCAPRVDEYFYFPTAAVDDAPLELVPLRCSQDLPVKPLTL